MRGLVSLICGLRAAHVAKDFASLQLGICTDLKSGVPKLVNGVIVLQVGGPCVQFSALNQDRKKHARCVERNEGASGNGINNIIKVASGARIPFICDETVRALVILTHLCELRRHSITLFGP